MGTRVVVPGGQRGVVVGGGAVVAGGVGMGLEAASLGGFGIDRRRHPLVVAGDGCRLPARHSCPRVLAVGMPAGLQLLVNVDEKSLGAMVGVDVETGSEPSDPPGLSKFYDRNCDVNVDPHVLREAEIKHGCVWVVQQWYQIRRGVKGSMSLKRTMGAGRDWSGWEPDCGVGKLWIGDWEFDLIVNCCHKAASYPRWPFENLIFPSPIFIESAASPAQPPWNESAASPAQSP